MSKSYRRLGCVYAVVLSLGAGCVPAGGDETQFDNDEGVLGQTASSEAALAQASSSHGRRADLTRSGSRLSAQYATRPGGFRAPINFHDRQLGVDCHYGQAENGDWRCFPPSDWQYFLDPTCSTQQVKLAHTSDSQPKPGDYAATFSMDLATINDVRLSGFKVVQEIPLTTVYWGALGMCEPELNPGYRLYTLAPVPDSTFVKGSFHLDWVGGSRIYAQTVHGTDGSRSHVWAGTGMYYDVQLQQPVAPVNTRESSPLNQEFLWAPTSPSPDWIRLTEDFSDASCQTRVAAIDLGPDAVLGADSVTGTTALNQSCKSYLTKYFKVKSTPLTQLYTSAGGTCSPQVISDPYTQFFQVSRKPWPGEYVTGSLRLNGNGRISKYEVANSDGSIAMVGGLYDHTLGRTCDLIWNNAGGMNCVPFDGNSRFEPQGLNYLDAACTQPVIGATWGIASEACYQGPVSAYLLDSRPGTVATLYRGGPRLTTAPVPLYFNNNVGGTCYPGGEGHAYGITSQVTVPLATFSVVRRKGHGASAAATQQSASALRADDDSELAAETAELEAVTSTAPALPVAASNEKPTFGESPVNRLVRQALARHKAKQTQ